ncbi:MULTISPECIES: peptidoglycan D,D-transpeptidase FtsI family protein [Mycobacteroides]|uniref:Cell division protein FtsI n=2 Tax=Mycobacteroides chelonae TaxID=1774 RepID=A0A1S1KNX3_MYCCH|nr:MULTISPECIES: penicillin-binding protein 2 [Mycobacteroides]AMW19557.1 cell division protein FtsI [Mycobacterium sp. QIA-37]SKM05023.1 Probable penicillin-binding membrane protein PbpB [Mycobacteroides abscessus subsp. bolletii]AYM41802.1 penicillin-binding protein 2 [[Mycobacterium] chelonae subsp. gwanakae]KRQ22301.1 cell division protein FtsI [Mycobacteroides sp. H003]KRQ25096.1 cell division protein FtsI [Mycobacteroides sp. H072]
MNRQDRSRPVGARRVRRPASAVSRTAGFAFRHRTGNIIIFLTLAVVALQLFTLQGPRAAGLRAEASGQLKVTETEKALRGTIVDRVGNKLAFTIEARALTFQPKKIREQLKKSWEESLKILQDPGKSDAVKAAAAKTRAVDPERRLQDIAAGVSAKLGNKPDAKSLLKKIRSDDTFAYLARSVDPAIAAEIVKEFPEVGAERQDIRQYPGGSLAANIVGSIDWEGYGLLGLEDSLDSALAGKDGSQTYDRGSDGAVIPGSYRDRHNAVNGSTVELTLDNDIQFYVQQQVQQAKDLSEARTVSAVVLDSKTGEVLAMANDNTFDPSQNLGKQGNREMGNLSVSSPFEPGSVNKVITASAVIENDLSNPDEVLQVPGSINMGGVTVRDAWPHGTVPFTTTGVFGKSSNVGTLMLAQRVGPERFMDLVDKFGLGQRTGVGLPGESSGIVPPIEQWSGSTFSNLPIGQGLSMTLLQMTGMYQAIANDGVRMPPRIVKSITAPDGTRKEEPRPEPVQVVNAGTARTVRNMLRAVLQPDARQIQNGTGASGAVEGYQLSGKTGTAQQINPACGCYFDDVYWITFAGIATTDDPRYVIGIEMNAPKRGSDGSPHMTAAPLFHNIASWLMRRQNVPLSPDPGPPLILQAT